MIAADIAPGLFAGGVLGVGVGFGAGDRLMGSERTIASPGGAGRDEVFLIVERLPNAG